MSRLLEISASVKGGLPVIALVRTWPAEPDVGIFSTQVEIEDILWTNGKPVTQRVYDSIPASDLEAIKEKAIDYD